MNASCSSRRSANLGMEIGTDVVGKRASKDVHVRE